MRRSSLATNPAALLDEAIAMAKRHRGARDRIVAVGYGVAQLFGPDGALKQSVPFVNLITDLGDEVYSKRGGGVSTTLATGMRLGTGATAAAKNGAGAAIVTYVAGSNKAIDGGFPTAATKGAGLGWRTQYQTTWGAGVATANNIQEAVISNESPLTDVAGVAGNTISRALLAPVVNKGALDSLVVTWNHDFLGA